MKKRTGKRILKITIKRMIDESPDTSWLGEYSQRSTSEFSIYRDSAIGRNEYRYFNPSFNYVDNNGQVLPEYTAEQVRKYVRQDYERMESLNRGDWCFIGVVAEAEVWNPKTQVVQKIHSGGLWGIESDSEEGYIKEEENNQLAELRTELLAYGFRSRAISKAFENVEHKG